MTSDDTVADVASAQNSVSGEQRLDKIEDLVKSSLSHWDAYRETGHLSQLQSAIQLSELAVKGDTGWGTTSYNLAVQLQSRYMRLQIPSDLERAIELAQEGIKESAHYDHQISLLSLFGSLLECRYRRYKAQGDIEAAVRHGRDALNVAQRGHSERAISLTVLGHILWSWFESSGFSRDVKGDIQVTQETVDAPAERASDPGFQIMKNKTPTELLGLLDEAIELLKEAVRLTPVSDPIDYLDRLGLLVEILTARHLATGSQTDLDRALQLGMELLKLMQRGHPRRASTIDEFLHLLRIRYSAASDAGDLAESVHFIQEVTDLILTEHPSPINCLASIVSWLRVRYSKLESAADLDEIIRLTQSVLSIMPKNSPYRSRCLGVLERSLSARYDKLGKLVDLENMIEVTLDLVPATQEDHTQQKYHFGRLCQDLREKFLISGNLDDLRLSVHFGRKLLPHVSLETFSQRNHLFGLAGSLSDMYGQTGHLDDLDEAIDINRRLVTSASQTDGEFEAINRQSVMALCSYLQIRYRATGASEDFQEAMRLSQELAQTMGPSHPEGGLLLQCYANSLHMRYEKTRASKDLEVAITITRTALGKIDRANLNWAEVSGMLQTQLMDRHARSNRIQDLDEALKLAQDALDQSRITDRVSRLNRVALLHSRRYYKHGRAPSDAEKNIRLLQEALELTSEPKTTRGIILNNLWVAMHDAYIRTHQIEHLDKAIQLREEANGNMSEHGLDTGARLASLAGLYALKTMRTGRREDIAKVNALLNSCLTHEIAPTEDRIMAGKDLIRFSLWDDDSEGALRASQNTVRLLPSLITQALENSDKQQQLRKLVGLGPLAARAAIYSEQEQGVALDFLEQARGMIAASIEEVRTNTHALQRMHPGLSEKLVSLGRELDTPQTRENAEPGVDMPPWELGVTADRRHQISEEFEATIAEIRKQVDFEDFLQAPGPEQLRGAASDGPIAVINVTEFGCDAILVQKLHIRSLHLPLLKMRDIESRAAKRALGNLETLSWLWEVLAKPILDSLGFRSRAKSGHEPHLWWIPTGPLSLFPIHAAGNYFTGSSDSPDFVLDRVISTYSTSVKAIIHGRRRPIKLSTRNRALLVGVERTPGSSPLPQALKELQLLRELCASLGISTVQPGRYLAANVKSLLPTCNLFHFAGHGYTNRHDPLESHLVLGEDGKRDLLTASDLLDLNLRTSAPFLAYLSACGTGQTGDMSSYDEGIHLASALQLAGFRHVIGTLWEVQDDLCVNVARLFYKSLSETGVMRDRSVSRALHRTILQLREQWMNSRISSHSADEIASSQINAGTKRGEQTWPDKSEPDLIKAEIQGVCRGLRKIALSIEEEEGSIIPFWTSFIHFGL